MKSFSKNSKRSSEQNKSAITSAKADVSVSARSVNVNSAPESNRKMLKKRINPMTMTFVPRLMTRKMKPAQARTSRNAKAKHALTV